MPDSRNDSRLFIMQAERLLDVLAPGGVLVWHDYAPVWPGVMRWLGELHARRPLCHITGTALVVDAAALPSP